MKLENISAGEFIALLKHTRGTVYLAAEDGVYFNLSSTLSQLYCIRMMLDNAGNHKVSPEIKFEDPEDEKMFRLYLLNHNTNNAKILK